MTTKVCDLCQEKFNGQEIEEWVTVKWMPGLHLSPRHRFTRFQFREYCPKCAKKIMKVGNVDFSMARGETYGDLAMERHTDFS